MKYIGMPMEMWVLFSKSFRDKLISVFGYRAGGVSDFVREYTLASGGPYCDCGYKKKRG